MTRESRVVLCLTFLISTIPSLGHADELGALYDGGAGTGSSSLAVKTGATDPSPLQQLRNTDISVLKSCQPRVVPDFDRSKPHTIRELYRAEVLDKETAEAAGNFILFPNIILVNTPGDTKGLHGGIKDALEGVGIAVTSVLFIPAIVATGFTALVCRGFDCGCGVVQSSSSIKNPTEQSSMPVDRRDSR